MRSAKAWERHGEIGINSLRDRPRQSKKPGSIQMSLAKSALLPKSALAVLVALSVSAAWAEGSPMPDEIAWKLQEFGRVIEPPKTAALSARLQEKEPYQAVKTERDVKYGAADRNLLDVFMPATA